MDEDAVHDFVAAVGAALPHAGRLCERRGKLRKGTAIAKCHAATMRKAKEAKAAQRGQVVSSHVQSQIDVMNERHAVRAGDVIDTSDIGRQKRRRLRGQGPGAANRWLPTALLRGAWSFVNDGIRQVNRGARRVSCALAASLRTVSMAMRVSHSHLRQVRAMMAGLYLELQSLALNSLVAPVYQVAEISGDETEHWVSLDGQREIHSVLMMHGRVLHRSAGGHKLVGEVVF